MKILMVSPTPTHPTTAGNRARILSLANTLRDLGHEVHFAFASMSRPDMAKPDLAAMRARFGDALHVLSCREPDLIAGVLPRLQRRLQRLLRSERAYLWSLDDYYDPALTPQIAALCASESFDAAFVEYVFMSKAFEAMPANILKVLDTHDSFALRHRKFLQAGLTPQWFSTSVAEETAGFRRADYVLAIQEREADIFAAQLGADGERVVAVGHLLDILQPVLPAAAPSAVFLASANPINVDAARYFIASVLPLVLREKPDFRFVLAGEVGSTFAGSHRAVTCLGQLPSVADAFRSAALAINPVRMGTGLSIKMLEALACGIACISSETGSRGLESHRNLAFESVPDDAPAAMASAVLSLLADPLRAAKLAQAGLELAQAWNRQQRFGLIDVLARKVRTIDMMRGEVFT